MPTAEVDAWRVFGEYHDRLRAEARKLCGDDAAASDLALRTLEAYLLDRDRYDSSKGPLIAWLKGILRNLWLESTRGKARAAVVYMTPDDLAIAAEARAELADGDERLCAADAELLRKMVDGLPPQMREVIVMHYFDGQRLVDIARYLRISESSVKSRLYYARRILAKRLGSEVRAHKVGLSLLAVALAIGTVLVTCLVPQTSVVSAMDECVPVVAEARVPAASVAERVVPEGPRTLRCVPEVAREGSGADWDHPLSLTNAIALAKAGDTLLLAAGTYELDATLTSSVPIMVRGGLQRGSDELLAANPISVLDFSRARGDGWVVIPGSGAEGEMRIERCALQRCPGRALVAYGGRGVTVCGCLFANNGSRLPSLSGGGALVATAVRMTVSDTRFVRNCVRGSVVRLVGACSGSVFDNCLFASNLCESDDAAHGGELDLELDSPAAGCEMSDCLVVATPFLRSASTAVRVGRGRLQVSNSTFRGLLAGADEQRDLYLDVLPGAYCAMTFVTLDSVGTVRGSVDYGPGLRYADPLTDMSCFGGYDSAAALRRAESLAARHDQRRILEKRGYKAFLKSGTENIL